MYLLQEFRFIENRTTYASETSHILSLQLNLNCHFPYFRGCDFVWEKTGKKTSSNSVRPVHWICSRESCVIIMKTSSFSLRVMRRVSAFVHYICIQHIFSLFIHWIWEWREASSIFVHRFVVANQFLLYCGSFGLHAWFMVMLHKE